MKFCAGLIFLPAALLAAPPPVATTPKAVDRAHMDFTADPCKDFPQYAWGRWLRTATIPGDRSSIGVFSEMEERNDALLRSAVKDAAAVGPDSKDPLAATQHLVGDFYASGMDETRIEKAGIRALAPELARIANVVDATSFAMELARLQRLMSTNSWWPNAPGFLPLISVDDKDSSRYLLALHQSGLGLPDRDYYLKEDDASKALRDAYKSHIASTFQLSGDAPDVAALRAQSVLDLETHLAKASSDKVALRDPQANYHKMDLVALKKLAPSLDWDSYFKGLGLSAPSEVNVQQPGFLQGFDGELLANSLPEWRTYLRWNLLRTASPFLGKDLEQEAFAFYDHQLEGLNAQPPRWKRVLDQTDMDLGEALGRLYVAKAFSPEAKAKALDLVRHVVEALRARIKGLDWMSASTKAEAMKKLDTLRIKVGYPEMWRDYTKVVVKRRAYVLNVFAAREFEFDRKLAQLGGPVDHSEWGMSPQTNNAYYDPSLNEIVFPAGGLQPPYFDPSADDASNYGTLGATVGHELTHGFDDQGRHYDSAGNLRNWWTPEDAARYQAKADALVKQFDGYEAAPGLFINGKLTLGENIADLGGLVIAWDAWKAATQGQELKPLDGFTPEQRFFLAYAESWRTLERPEALKLQVQTNEHAPAKWRVIGPLADFPEFQKAFHCPAPLAPAPSVW